jgi:hypothetical protein
LPKRLPLLVIVACLLASGCLSSTETRQLRSDSSTDVEVPFVRSLPLSSSPPAVAFHMEGGKGVPLNLKGVLYSSDWVTTSGSWSQLPRVPVPWPQPSPVSNRGSAATVVFATAAVPDEIQIRGYSRIDSHSGEPTVGPRLVYLCHRFGQPNCSFSVSGSDVSISHIEPDIVSSPYLVVFAIWGIPPDQRSAESSEASGSWLFRGQAVS